jgi:hypothetical protein
MRRSIRTAFEDEVATLRHLVQAQAEQFEARQLERDAAYEVRLSCARTVDGGVGYTGVYNGGSCGAARRSRFRSSTSKSPHALVRNRLSHGLLVLAAVTFRSRRAPSPSTGFPSRARDLQSTSAARTSRCSDHLHDTSRAPPRSGAGSQPDRRHRGRQGRGLHHHVHGKPCACAASAGRDRRSCHFLT